MTDKLTDFAETASLIDQVDLVIAIDTAVAHLAGALGKPVWTLLPFGGEWRWLFRREDTPWYPNMRLFRQRILGDWRPVFQRIGASLTQMVGAEAGVAQPGADTAVGQHDTAPEPGASTPRNKASANSPLKKALLTGFHSTAKHNATKAVSPSSETMRTI